MTGSAGRFEVYEGLATGSLYHLKTSADSWQFGAPLEVHTGQQDIEFIVHSTVAARGRLSGDKQLGRLGLTLEAKGSVAGGSRSFTSEESTRLVNGEGRFQFRNLPPGRYDFRVLSSARLELGRLLGVDLIPGEAKDLGVIHLDDTTRSFELLALNGTGEALRSSLVRFRQGEEEGFPNQAKASRGKHTIVCTSPTVDALVLARGKRPQVVLGLAQSGSVELENGPTISLQLPKAAFSYPGKVAVVLQPRTPLYETPKKWHFYPLQPGVNELVLGEAGSYDVAFVYWLREKATPLLPMLSLEVAEKQGSQAWAPDFPWSSLEEAARAGH